MKLKLSLTKSQYQGLAVITRSLINTGHLGDEFDFEIFSYKTVLEELALRFASNLVMAKVKKKQTVKLSEMQTLAMYELLNRFVDQFAPFEHALGCQILEAIDKQHQNETSLRMGARNAAKQLE